jgi:hypothetical protein
VCVCIQHFDTHRKMHMHHTRIVICALSGSNTFFHIISQTTKFSKKIKVLKIEYGLWFSLQFLPETFLILKKNWAIYDQICTVLRVCPLVLSDFNENLILSTNFRKILNCKISWKSFQWEPRCSMQTDRHYEANSRFSQFWEDAWWRIKIINCFDLKNF